MVKIISAWHALFNVGSKMSSVPMTFNIWRMRNIYSFYFHSTWFYLLFSHMADILLPLFSVHDTVQESWTRPHVGHPVLPEWRRACECLHTCTHKHTHACTHVQTYSQKYINYKRENWNHLLPKSAKVYRCGFLIITCYYKQKTLVITYIVYLT